jgi:hypothetical protein
MQYYTYAYLREDRTPYYIGKGEKDRIYKKGKGEVKPPKDKSRIIFLKQNLTEEEAFRHEKYMIAVFGRKDLGTGILRNRTNGGEGSSGAIHTPETRAKISAAMKGKNSPNYGKTLSPETKAKLSAAQKGKTLSTETKAKISAAQKGKTLSLETKAKISAAQKGKTLSPETKAKMSAAKKDTSRSLETRIKISESLKGENHPLYGKTLSPEIKAKISAATKGKNSHNYGKMWITNGEISKLIPIDEDIPIGYSGGMTKKSRRKKFNDTIPSLY